MPVCHFNLVMMKQSVSELIGVKSVKKIDNRT